jgi:hypothetical protein
MPKRKRPKPMPRIPTGRLEEMLRKFQFHMDRMQYYKHKCDEYRHHRRKHGTYMKHYRFHKERMRDYHDRCYPPYPMMDSSSHSRGSSSGGCDCRCDSSSSC